MTTENGPVCDQCQQPLPSGSGFFVGFFFPHKRYCSQDCLDQQEEQRRRDSLRRCYRVQKYKQTRYWAVIDGNEELVCVTVYKRGAEEIVRRLSTPVK